MTFALWRVLGNDLPPRHGRGQTRSNLSFILDHEPSLAGCTKHWIVNRIADGDEEARILAILDRHDQPYLRIRFRLEEYATCATRGSAAAEPLEGGPSLNAARRHAKCLYVMNVNAARNLAIDEGRRIAEWILPLDGNCCFTAEGWAEVVRRIAAAPAPTRCFAIPMFRLKDNREYFGFSTVGRTPHEPQLIVGRESGVRFDPSYRYGADSKVELLKRLTFPFTRNESHQLTDANAACGYVTRLFSGVAAGEEHWTARAELREAAIDRALDRLDAAIETSRMGQGTR